MISIKVDDIVDVAFNNSGNNEYRVKVKAITTNHASGDTTLDIVREDGTLVYIHNYDKIIKRSA